MSALVECADAKGIATVAAGADDFRGAGSVSAVYRPTSKSGRRDNQIAGRVGMKGDEVASSAREHRHPVVKRIDGRSLPLRGALRNRPVDRRRARCQAP
jgi:hypothetical protein